MSSLFKVYQRLLHKYPLRVQAVQAGTLMALGDQIAQNVIEQREFKNLDFKRTMQFGSIGLFIGGPATRTWYGILDKYIGSKGKIVVLKKVACDQLFFAPMFIAILLTVINMFQEHDFKTLQLKMQQEYFDILKNNYKVWPMVQLANFYFVPLQYQVLAVQSIALLWNTYISYRTSLDRQVDKQ